MGSLCINVSYGVTKKKEKQKTKSKTSLLLFVTLRMKMHFSHVICMLIFFPYIFAVTP